jgi:hypothetical protein
MTAQDDNTPTTRPTRRTILKFATGTAIAGAAGILSAPAAQASSCTDACNQQYTNCTQFCIRTYPRGSEGYARCLAGCREIFFNCLSCCQNGGTAGECAQPIPGIDGSVSNFSASLANNLLVAAEIGYAASNPLYGMLRARTRPENVGPWEKFIVDDLNPDDNGRVAIRSNANGLYVSAEIGYSSSDPRYGMLRARARTVGPWETFRWGFYNSGTVYGYSNVLIAANGSYVSTELGYTGSTYAMLRARPNQKSIGPWEQFFWQLA